MSCVTCHGNAAMAADSARSSSDKPQTTVAAASWMTRKMTHITFHYSDERPDDHAFLAQVWGTLKAKGLNEVWKLFEDEGRHDMLKDLTERGR